MTTADLLLRARNDLADCQNKLREMTEIGLKELVAEREASAKLRGQVIELKARVVELSKRPTEADLVFARQAAIRGARRAD